MRISSDDDKYLSKKDGKTVLRCRAAIIEPDGDDPVKLAVQAISKRDRRYWRAEIMGRSERDVGPTERQETARECRQARDR